MSLDLRNFVQVNINYHTAAVSSVDRGIVTLITANTTYSGNPYKGEIFYSESEYAKAHAAAPTAVKNDTSLDLYVKSFFANKGKGLQIIGGYTGNATDSEIAAWIGTVLAALDYRFVIITSDCSVAALEMVAIATASTNVVLSPLTQESTVPTFSGLNEKFFVSSSNDPTFTSSLGEDVQNFVVKIGMKGCEMMAAAFLSQIKITEGPTISDYNFTIENVQAFKDAEDPADPQPIVIEDNDTGVTLINNNLNFDTTLVNAIRNIGGNTTSGADITNYYIRILLTQDITEKVLRVLVSKIRLNQEGINRVQNAIQIEMNKYIDNGYLNQEFIWTEENLEFSWNNQSYRICSRNEPLVKGYKCVILPVSSLTRAQKESHAFPPVYILLADQTGIRSVLIRGDVY